jgi:hypothetical protein
LEVTLAQQRKDFEAAIAQLKGQIQKVSAELDVTSPLRAAAERAWDNQSR